MYKRNSIKICYLCDSLSYGISKCSKFGYRLVTSGPFSTRSDVLQQSVRNKVPQPFWCTLLADCLRNFSRISSLIQQSHVSALAFSKGFNKYVRQNALLVSSPPQNFQNYMNAIHAAVTGNAFRLFYLVYSSEVPVDAANLQGITLLHWAVQNDHVTVVRILLRQMHICCPACAPSK